MITITQDAELMTNILAANPVPVANAFAAFTDGKQNPGVVSHSQDDKLEVIMHVAGKPQMFDLNEIWRIQGAIQAFGLVQDENHHLWIAIAAKADNNQSRFYLIYDVDPGSLLSFSSEHIIEASELYPEVHAVYMSKFTRTVQGKRFPLIFLAFQPRERITKEDQLGYVKFSVKDGKLDVSLNREWSLASNTLKILDVAFGTCSLGKGVFALYEVPDGYKLQFRVFEDGRGFSAELAAPKGATSVAAYEEGKKTTFIVGGNVITRYKWKEYTNPKSNGTTIISSDTALDPRDLYTAQSGDHLTIWYTTSASAVYYYSTTTKSAATGNLVQLLPEGSGGRISGLLFTNDSRSVVVKTLVSVDETGKLSVLQQGSDTGMWETHPFYVTSHRHNMEIDCFTLRLAAHTDSATADQNTRLCQLRLTTSGYVRVLLNGTTTTLDEKGAWYTADEAGVATLIIPTADMACHTLRVVGFRAQNGSEMNLDVEILNPSRKLNAKLTSIKTGKDLLNAKTQSGEQLIEPGSLSKDDANYAASVLKQLNDEQIRLDKESREKGASAANLSMAEGSATASGEAKKLSFWDYFHLFMSMARTIKEYWVHKIGGALHFVVKWAGKEYRFLLDSNPAIGKAMSWVWEKIGVPLEKVIKFIGFLFNWDFILTYSDSIVTFINAGLDYGLDLVDEADEKVKEFVKTCRKLMGERKQPASIETSADSTSKYTTSASEDYHHSVGGNWVQYQLRHGGTAEHATVDSPADEEDNLWKDVWTDIKNQLGVFMKLVQSLAENIVDLFKKKKCSTSDIFAAINDPIVNAMCDTMDNLADAVLKIIKILLISLKKGGNCKIEIPIFSGIWKRITGGRDFTLFNCIALFLAIPTSIMHKLFVLCRKDAPKIKDKFTKTEFKKFVKGDKSLDPELALQLLVVAALPIGPARFIGFEIWLLGLTFQETGAEDIAKVVSPKKNDFFDLITLNLGLISLGLDWPLSFKSHQDIRWTIWGMELLNVIALGCARKAGTAGGIPYLEICRLTTTAKLMTGIGIYVLKLYLVADEAGWSEDKKDGDVDAGHVIQNTFSFLLCVSSFVDVLMVDEQPEISAAAKGFSLAFLTGMIAMVIINGGNWGSKYCSKYY